ncbi:exported protein of unknown function [Blastococcus saxobsidens DD2]|uniref:Uncharacterized protein n=1 Tax=Blastococcus saxobsidens (strain DD2) TaxID=1146883 RepID=H6RLF1_BLASD|nr:exported protein of unknown function [Blastococcus saxobsidens DD2]
MSTGRDGSGTLDGLLRHRAGASGRRRAGVRNPSKHPAPVPVVRAGHRA